MLAFADMPRLEPPTALLDKSRIFELRVYESHSRQAAKKKIDMFNEGGEIAIFRKTGLQPVFFGETLFGPAMPNLTYMLVFDSMASRDANRSGVHPAGERPDPLNPCRLSPSQIKANASLPMPLLVGSTTVSAIAVASAASIAFPPFASI